jgi:rhodanese-related sulfurtransferase
VDQVAREFMPDRAGDPLLSRDELTTRLNQGKVILLDVRPPAEYQHGHLPQAVSIPVADLPHRLNELPRDRTIVCYCRGDFCLFADEAVAILRENGYHAVRLEGGWPEWQAEGRPVVTAGRN